MQQIIAGKNEAGQRLSKLLDKYLNQAPTGFVYKMLRKKNIILNGKKADGSERVAEGDEIMLYLSDETIEKFSRVQTDTTEVPLDILYEDDHILIINKEAGMLSQKARPEDTTLVEYMTAYLLGSGTISMDSLRSFRPGLCNRLDRNTSGLILAGKSLAGLQAMGDLIKRHNLNKYYLCIVKGRILEKRSICGYLLKDTSHNKSAVSELPVDGADFIHTEYEPLCSNETLTFLKVRLITGRSHQIRAHLSSMGHPLAGDGKYGDVPFNRNMKRKYRLRFHLLHSYCMEFPQLDGVLSGLSEACIKAPLPDYFEKIVRQEFEDKNILSI